MEVNVRIDIPSVLCVGENVDAPFKEKAKNMG